MRSFASYWALGLLAASLFACSKEGSGVFPTADGGAPITDGGVSRTDASPTPTVDSGTTGIVHEVTTGAGGALTFSPAAMTIRRGDTVTWRFASAGHTVTSGSSCTADNLFCSPDDTRCTAARLSSGGDSYSHTFNTTGTFPYFCAVHCSLGMTGTITVTP